MMQVSFSACPTYDLCPVWWRNFGDAILGDLEDHMPLSLEDRDRLLAEAISKFNGVIHPIGSEEVDYLEFQTEDDFIAFKMYWTLYGK
jgi:hypothetical protein